ncbi:MAG: histidine phosphatase family protein [Thalassobaculum sp.]
MARTATALLIVFALLSLVGPRTGSASPEGWEAMARPGAIAVMRHAYAPGYSDPSNFRLDDCSTQRNLNDAGRDQARRIGAAFRDNGIEVDRVLTSQWCRSAETAELLGSERSSRCRPSTPSSRRGTAGTNRPGRPSSFCAVSRRISGWSSSPIR